MAQSNAEKLRQEIKASYVVGAGYDYAKMVAAFRRAYGPFAPEKWINLMIEHGYSVFLHSSDDSGKVPGLGILYPEGRCRSDLATPEIWLTVEAGLGNNVHRSVIEHLMSARA